MVSRESAPPMNAPFFAARSEPGAKCNSVLFARSSNGVVTYVPLNISVRLDASSSADCTSAVQSLALLHATTTSARRATSWYAVTLLEVTFCEVTSGPQQVSWGGGRACASNPTTRNVTIMECAPVTQRTNERRTNPPRSRSLGRLGRERGQVS